MPLRTVKLGVDGLETTALGFGCANIFRLPRSAQRIALLEAAYEAGVRHFDTAPMYGIGLAEGELGRFAKTRRDKITITTKFGIRPSAAARTLARGQGPVRRALEALPALHERARTTAAGPSTGRLGALVYSSEGYGAAAARRGLERSLRALGTDYIDLFLLHNPAPGSVRPEELYGYLDGARHAGLIRSWGIAGEPPEPTIELAGSFSHPVPVLQLHDDIFLRSLRQAGSAANTFITFGALGATIYRLVEHVTADGGRRERWNAELGVDCGEPEVAASLLLRAALRENKSGVVLFSSVRPHRILSAVASAELPETASSPSLSAFFELIEGDLRESQRIGGGRA